MSAGTAGTAQPLVLRASGAALVPVAVWIVCGLAVVDGAVEGSTGYALSVAVLMAAIAFATWLLLASPCLVVQRDGLRIVNPLRVHWVPFAALDTVTVRGLTTVTARRESGQLRTITSWNAPGVPRRYAAATPPTATATTSTAAAVERARTSWEHQHSARQGARQGARQETAALVTTWRWRPALVLVALVAANIAIWLR